MKIIKDLVHGYIEIDETQEKIINTLNFQRLKDIFQLTSQHVYPSATHNRFEHSLGVMYLAREAFSRLNSILTSKFCVTESHFDKLKFHLNIAALLHDVGHAPFSHLGEKYYRKKEIQDRIHKLIVEKKCNIDISIFQHGSNHELMSCYIIIKKYIDIIKHGNNSADIEFICRCIVGATYDTDDMWLEDITIELLNSKTVDMDKLDYLIRDAFMTGVSVPVVDLKRLFNNIFINPKTKRISFCSQALPVIQNIIDARDSLYLWVYNHHTVVYTDFVIEFYIKHMINNFEKKNKFSDQLNPEDYFSCDAISEKLVSNSDLYTKLKGSLSILPQDLSKYTHQILPQLFERKFLKPLWKTIYDYRNFLESNIGDSTLIRELEQKMCDNDYCYRRYVAVKLIEKCDLNLGQVFIVPRSNKFYSLDPNSVFHVFLHDKDKQISQLLPQKDFKELYHNVAFYVFVESDKLDKIKEAFIDIVSSRLPSKNSILGDSTDLDWFNI